MLNRVRSSLFKAPRSTMTRRAFNSTFHVALQKGRSADLLKTGLAFCIVLVEYTYVATSGGQAGDVRRFR